MLVPMLIIFMPKLKSMWCYVAENSDLQNGC
jgi:hypothetical protein